MNSPIALCDAAAWSWCHTALHLSLDWKTNRQMSKNCYIYKQKAYLSIELLLAAIRRAIEVLTINLVGSVSIPNIEQIKQEQMKDFPWRLKWEVVIWHGTFLCQLSSLLQRQRVQKSLSVHSCVSFQCQQLTPKECRKHSLSIVVCNTSTNSLHPRSVENTLSIVVCNTSTNSLHPRSVENTLSIVVCNTSTNSLHPRSVENTLCP